MILDFFIFLLCLKREFDDQPLNYCDHYLSPLCKKYSDLVVKDLGRNLREEICLVVNPNTSSIFRYQNLKGPELIGIRAGRHGLQFNSKVDKSLLLFFVDKESLIHYPKYLEQGLELVHYTRSFVSNKHHHILREAYKNLKNINFNFKLEFYEFNILKSNTEIRVEHYDIGVIHNTLYENAELETHFKLFLNNLSFYNMYEIAEKYIKSLLDYLYDLGILKTKENIDFMNLFPYQFTRDLFLPFTGEKYITGGICFDKLTKQQKRYFDRKKINNKSRFVFTYFCKISSKNISLDPVR